MSHTTTLKGVQIKSASAIRTTVQDLKNQGIDISLATNEVPRMYYREQEREIGKCEFVLKLGNSRYDVGLKWNEKEQQYDAFLDTWAGSIKNAIGASCAMPRDAGEQGEHAIGLFSQRYGINAAKEAASAAGYYVEREFIDEDGTVQLELGGM